MLKLVKLVRDKIPEGLDEHHPVVCKPITDRAEMVERLRDKLFEEAREYDKNPSIGEAADIYEVLCCLIEHDLHAKLGDVILAADNKRRKRGSFLNGIGMYVEVADRGSG